MTRKEREEIKELSKEVYGSTGKWRKLLENGYLVKDDTYKAKSKKDKSHIVKCLTEDTIKAYLVEKKEQKQRLLDAMKKSVDDSK